MDGWVDGWMDGWMDGWAVGWVDGWMYNTHLTRSMKEDSSSSKASKYCLSAVLILHGRQF